MLPSRRHLRGSADKHEKNLFQWKKSKTQEEISVLLFQVVVFLLWEVLMWKAVSLKVLLDDISFIVIETVHGKNSILDLPFSLHCSNVSTRKQNGPNHSSCIRVTTFWSPLTLLLISRSSSYNLFVYSSLPVRM